MINIAAIRMGFLTCFGVGLLRPASGTWGSMPPVILALALVWLLAPSEWTFASYALLNCALALFGLVFAIACIRFGHEAESHFHKKDPGSVVADEVAGQSLVLLFLPWHAGDDLRTWQWNVAIALTAFLTFRIMDIIKPRPARSLQSLEAGWGILIDDLVAGVYAAIIVQLATRIGLPLML